ncbi:MAG TPA: glycosyltransferase family 4 protein, partial [Gemmataceae bacterium]|nr:glycosyltransferase family 4 protein [Gemmataceae bacterium]
MRVLHLTISFATGGRRRAITTLIERLRVQGVECDLGCLEDLNCPWRDVQGLAESVEILRRETLVDWKVLRKLIRICDERGIDAIHAHDAASQFTAALARLLRSRIKLVMTFHRSLGFESARFQDRLRNALACFQSGAIITGSRERRAHFLKENYVPARKVVRIPFGIDTDQFCPNPENARTLRQEHGWNSDTVVLGAVGYFSMEKGIDQVIQGFQVLLQRSPPGNPVLVIIGRGTPVQEKNMNRLVKGIPPNRVLLLGFQPHVEQWFQAFDIFVHAPRLEAFGLVVTEAMAAGLPVVATDIGGVPDQVRDGSTGFLVPPGDVYQLADAMERLIRDPPLRRSL